MNGAVGTKGTIRASFRRHEFLFARITNFGALQKWLRFARIE
jgi:hypothetical protein